MKGWAILRLCACFQHVHKFSLVIHQNTNLGSVKNGFADTAKDPPKLILRKEEIFRCVWQNQLWGHSRTRASLGLITEVRQILRLGLGEQNCAVDVWLAATYEESGNDQLRADWSQADRQKKHVELSVATSRKNHFNVPWARKQVDFNIGMVNTESSVTHITSWICPAHTPDLWNQCSIN